ncbi:apoptotic protease-activating factor 1 [Artemisia annua]|uniref:Apoptotic protease-activating factor 1 n=1 Tax=Artemisia annua TaxID=35608 RepID=A0A2U1KGG5_ARTAN|nr:apoptotic protease-activating factor 1 [Artemisia annua]
MDALDYEKWKMSTLRETNSIIVMFLEFSSWCNTITNICYFAVQVEPTKKKVKKSRGIMEEGRVMEIVVYHCGFFERNAKEVEEGLQLFLSVDEFKMKLCSSEFDHKFRQLTRLQGEAVVGLCYQFRNVAVNNALLQFEFLNKLIVEVSVVGSHKGICRFYNTADFKLEFKEQIELKTKKKPQPKKKTGFQFSSSNLSEVLVHTADSQIRILDGAKLVQKYKGVIKCILLPTTNVSPITNIAVGAELTDGVSSNENTLTIETQL